MKKEGSPPPLQRPPRTDGPFSQWKFPLWYLPFMIFLLWIWQGTVSQFAVRTIPYSEFKEHLARGQVSEASVKTDEITGTIQTNTATTEPKTATTTTNVSALAKKDDGKFVFRTI